MIGSCLPGTSLNPPPQVNHLGQGHLVLSQSEEPLSSQRPLMLAAIKGTCFSSIFLSFAPRAIALTVAPQ